MKYYLKLGALWAILTAAVTIAILLIYGVVGFIASMWAALLPTAAAGFASGVSIIALFVAFFVLMMREELVSKD